MLETRVHSAETLVFSKITLLPLLRDHLYLKTTFFGPLKVGHDMENDRNIIILTLTMKLAYDSSIHSIA